jgi:hypothetical protein
MAGTSPAMTREASKADPKRIANIYRYKSPPLCPHPQEAWYNGGGDRKVARSFT